MKLMSIPNAVSLCLLGIFCALLTGQLHVISMQNNEINELLKENAELRSNLSDTEDKIDTLFATHADIKTFQDELDTWVKQANFGPMRKFGHLLKPHASDKAPAFSIVHNNDAKPMVRLAKIEMATERVKHDLSSLLKEALRIKNFIFELPTQKPALGIVTSKFGKRIDPFTKRLTTHKGIDIAAPPGSPVWAPAEGKVVLADYSPTYGNRIDIQHGHGLLTRHAHLESRMVKKGDLVARGQQIGKVGKTGRCKGSSHLHYEIIQGNSQLDPMPFLVSAPPTSKNIIGRI